MSSKDKPLAWLHGKVKSPPLSKEGRIEAGFLLRRLQRGESLGMPHSRPMPNIGQRCHELRIGDASGNWRVILHRQRCHCNCRGLPQKTPKTPKTVVETCRRRFKEYDDARK